VARELPLLRLTLRAAVEWRWGGGDGGGGGDMTGGGHGTDGGAPTALLALIDERWTSVLRELRRLSAEPQGEAPRSHPPNLHRRSAAAPPAPAPAPAPPTPALPAVYQCALWVAGLRRYATGRLPALLAEPEERGSSYPYPYPYPDPDPYP